MTKNFLSWMARQRVLIQLYPLMLILLVLTSGVVAFLEVQEEKRILFKGIEKEGVVYILGLQREFSNMQHLRGKSEEEIVVLLQERLEQSLKHHTKSTFSIAHIFLLDREMKVLASSEKDHKETRHEDENIRRVIETGEIYVGDVEEDYFDPIHRVQVPVTDLIAPLYVRHEIFGAIELEMDVSKTMKMLTQQYRNVFIKDASIILVSALFFFLLFHLLLRKFLVEPLQSIEDRMRFLAKSSLDLDDRDVSRNELENLSNIFERMQSELQLQMEELGKKKEMEQELKIAQEIQKKMLPQEPPEISGYELFGMNLSCTDIGGDYFDFIPLSRNRYGIVIGDVSGHGVGAALLMASARSTLRGLLVESDLTTGRIVTDLNDAFEQDVNPGSFMTMVYGILEPETGKYCYTNAGHIPPLVYNPSNGDFRRLESHGFMVGIFENSTFGEGSVTLEPGEILVLFTDGIVEQGCERNGSEEYFSQERFEAIIRSAAHLPLDDITEKITDELYRFANKTSFDDDVTLVMVRRNSL